MELINEISSVNKIKRKKPNNNMRVYCSFDELIISRIKIYTNNKIISKVREIDMNNSKVN